jgi:hypothetical protein
VRFFPVPSERAARKLAAMAAFNAIVLMSTNHWSARPGLFFVWWKHNKPHPLMAAFNAIALMAPSLTISFVSLATSAVRIAAGLRCLVGC